MCLKYDTDTPCWAPPLMPTRAREQKFYFNCTDPDTVTNTVVFPASTGTGASDTDALASMAIRRGRGGAS